MPSHQISSGDRVIGPGIREIFTDVEAHGLNRPLVNMIAETEKVISNARELLMTHGIPYNKETDHINFTQ
jgi:hypothetical protein